MNCSLCLVLNGMPLSFTRESTITLLQFVQLSLFLSQRCEPNFSSSTVKTPICVGSWSAHFFLNLFHLFTVFGLFVDVFFSFFLVEHTSKLTLHLPFKIQIIIWTNNEMWVGFCLSFECFWLVEAFSATKLESSRQLKKKIERKKKKKKIRQLDVHK